jgi:hypothetical protein
MNWVNMAGSSLEASDGPGNRCLLFPALPGGQGASTKSRWEQLLLVRDSEKLGAPVAVAVDVTTADGIDFHVIVGHGLNVRFSFHGEHSFSVRSHHGWREEEYEVVAVAGTFPA